MSYGIQKRKGLVPVISLERHHQAEVKYFVFCFDYYKIITIFATIRLRNILQLK